MDRCKLEILDVEIPGSAAKAFTPSQANRSLVLVRRIVEDLASTYAQSIELQQVLECAQIGPDYGQRRTAERRLAEIVEQLQEYLWELDELGVELQDWTTGQVDFPACIAGRNIYLSWRLGDSEVRYWHEPQDRFEQLHTIDTLPTPQSQPA